MGLTTDIERRYNDYLCGDSCALRLQIMLVCSLLVLHFDAFRINWAISSGCVTSDAWLELSDTIVTFIRSVHNVS